MNLCKRAFLYSIRKKGKTISLLTFLLVMATLMLTCFSIQSATETANDNIKKALLGYFTINAKQVDTGITEDVKNEILSIDGLSGKYTLRSYTYASYYDTDGNPLTINTEDAMQVPDGYENAGKIVANTASENDSYFTDGGFELTEGTALTLTPHSIPHRRKWRGWKQPRQKRPWKRRKPPWKLPLLLWRTPGNPRPPLSSTQVFYYRFYYF